ncbi:MAG: hypothetical protein Q4G59_05430 [Planctomycetia bacterium]|nr:hypothetical protein [Planctomycetia bacterium]
MSKNQDFTRRNFLTVSGTLVGSAVAGMTPLSSNETPSKSKPILEQNGDHPDIFITKKYSNWLWIELIGFDNEQPDFGIGSILERAGFVPAGFALLLYWVGFVTEHDGLKTERQLSPAEASYGGHPACPERRRQTWTNRQLKSLIDQLHHREIKVYLSFFNFCSYRNDVGKSETLPYFRDKDYLKETGRHGQWDTLSMLKRQKDGVWFEDYLQNQTVRTLVDYEFDGIQIADGISSPRLALQEGDYTPEMTSQFFEYLKTDRRRPVQSQVHPQES